MLFRSGTVPTPPVPRQKRRCRRWKKCDGCGPRRPGRAWGRFLLWGGGRQAWADGEMGGRAFSRLNVVYGSGSHHNEDGSPSKDRPESAPAPRRLRVQPMRVDLVALGDHEHDIPDEFGCFHWQQDTSCSASRKTSYFDDRTQSDCVAIKAASSAPTSQERPKLLVESNPCW